MKTSFFRIAALSLVVICSPLAALAAGDVALITALDGGVTRATDQGTEPLQSFVKLKEGDQLRLDKSPRLQIVYFDGGRQETWSGSGKLEIARSESKATGLPAPQVKTLPPVMVKQIARTPALDVHGRGGVTRLRSLAAPGAVEQMEATYAELRAATTPNDLNPEFYLLSGLFELRQLDRVEQAIARLQRERKDNAQAGLLVAIYKKALKDVRQTSAGAKN